MKERIVNILSYLKNGLYEREEIIALSLLSALSGESIFLLGYPGVGKSLVARRLKGAFKDARSFEYLMSRFSTPDEIFGPVSISKLKEADTYERITKGYLPESEILFLDEIWKAGPAIQNALLTVLNEKIYLNGSHEMKLPVKAIISASNELPAEGEGLEALWDRFIIRYIVEPISDRRNFESLLCNNDNTNFETEFQSRSGDTPDAESQRTVCAPLTPDECQLIMSMRSSVTLPKEIVDVIYNIRTRLNNKMAEGDDNSENENDSANLKYYISDRRWKKAVGVMRTSALLNGRTAVDLSDAMLLVHMLWNDDSTLEEMHRIVCEETASTLFKSMLDRKKSPKRHALRKDTESLFSPDDVYYLVMCDGFNLKVRIDDYNRLLKSGEYTFASETKDECLVILDKGSYSIQVNTPGMININGYNYPLVKSIERQMSSESLSDFADSAEGILSRLLSQISENIFVNDARFIPLLKSVFVIYRNKMK